MTSPSSALPVARFTTPAEIAAAIPVLTGFVPRESVVVLSLRPPRKRIGLTMRFDLPPDDLAHVLAAEVAARLEHDGAMTAVVAVYTESPELNGRRAGQALVDAIEDVHPVSEALLVRDGRWWSYLCSGASCCPSEGTPLEDAASPALELLATECTLKGRAVLASREELVASIAPPQLLAAVVAEQRLDAAAESFVTALAEPRAATEAALASARRLLDAGCDEPVGPAAAADFAMALHLKAVRDEIATWGLDRADDLLGLLIQVARQVVPPYDAPICTLLAWISYAEGNGALANVALDRALDTDPDYTMAGLLRQALDTQMAPADVRRLLRSTRDALT
ncbi:MAG: hypothetical protein QOE99_1057 [Actinomycetota bacterium]|jgi:hypothetical protein|nr:hypothetical protein [Actinomycetota bacterium]